MTRAGPVVRASIARASGRTPASTAASTIPMAVSMPLIPLAAQPNSTCLSTSVCGAWSVAMASAVPSRSAASTAAASSAGRSGGLTRSEVSNGAAVIEPSAHGSSASPASSSASQLQRLEPAIHWSVSARWCGVTSHVTGRPAAFAARTWASAAAVDTCVRWSRAPGTSRTTSARIAIARATAPLSADPGQPLSPSTVDT